MLSPNPTQCVPSRDKFGGASSREWPLHSNVGPPHYRSHHAKRTSAAAAAGAEAARAGREEEALQESADVRGRRARFPAAPPRRRTVHGDRKSTRLNSSHLVISYAVFCLKKKKKIQ